MSPYLTTPEAAAYLRRSPRTIRELKARDAIPYRQPVPNGKALFRADEMDRWLDGCELEVVLLPGGGRAVKVRA